MEFTIPINPASKKNSLRLVKNQKTGQQYILPSKQAAQYEKDSGWFIKAPREPIDYPVRLTAHFYRATRHNVDVANLLQALQDALKKHGVIEDDNYKIIAEVICKCSVDKEHPRTEVKLEPLQETATQENGTPLLYYIRTRQYLDHMLPIINRLPGCVIVEPAVREYAFEKGLEPEPAQTRQAIKEILKTFDGYVVVGCAMDLERLPDRKGILVNHGVGQTFGNRHRAFPGGEGRENAILFLEPNKRAADKSKEAYPDTRVEIVGCPKLDAWYNRVKIVSSPPVVAISFHWDMVLTPENRSAWRYYKSILPELVNKKSYKLIGHGHPAIFAQLEREYGRLGIPAVKHFDEVLARADLYAVDHSSTLYEFAATDRPVLVLNAPWYRREIEWGLRFWEFADVGLQVDDPRDLHEAILRALKGPPEVKARRREIIKQLYPHLGKATELATKAILKLPPYKLHVPFSICVPWKPTPERTPIYEWIKAFYEKHLPEAEIVIGTDDSMPANRAKMRNRAVDQAKHDVIAIVDADVLIHPDDLRNLVKDIKGLVKYNRSTRLNEEATARILKGPKEWPQITRRDIQRTSTRRPRGGLFALNKSLFYELGGFDERFQGWGCEDSAFVSKAQARGCVYWRDIRAFHFFHISEAPAVWDTRLENEEYRRNHELFEEIKQKEEI